MADCVVACTHCFAPIQQNLLAAHEGVCPEAIVECSNDLCSTSFKRKLKNKHLSVCDHVLVDCRYSHLGCTHQRYRHVSAELHLKEKAEYHLDLMETNMSSHLERKLKWKIELPGVGEKVFSKKISIKFFWVAVGHL